MKGLHSLAPARGSTRRIKRLGRGNSSGKGNYSGKGIKGQRARSGGRSGIISRSIKSYLLRIPKTRGFKSSQRSYEFVNLGDLQQRFSDGARIDPRSLKKRGLVSGKGRGVKVLSRGTLSKKLHVSAHAFSAKAAAALAAAGGSAQVLRTEVRRARDA